jgi:membrane protease YdiL (CAAX protease family)
MKRLIPLAILALGIPLLLLIESFAHGTVAEILLLAGFILLNLAAAKFSRRIDVLKRYWCTKKIWHFFPGFGLGLIAIGAAYLENPPAYRGLSIVSALLTLATVSWEELWFRGLALNIAGKNFGKLLAAIIFGIIFAALHAMNPQIQLWIDGPQLAVAGTALSLCYFAFGSIWAPIGMHFANNGLETAFGQSTEPKSILYNGFLLGVATGLGLWLAIQKPSAESPFSE